jgi:AraC-like DNA-binding protein
MHKKVAIEQNNSEMSSLTTIPSPDLNSKISEKNAIRLLESSPICTKVLDLEFNLQYMSPSGIKSLHIDDITPFYGKPYPFDFYPKSFCENMKNNLIQAVKTKTIIEQEASVFDMEGNKLWFHSIITPVEDSNGRIESLLIISVNKTENRKAEIELSAFEHSQKRIGGLKLAEQRSSNCSDSNFMMKVKRCVTVNLSDSNFDVNVLAKKLFMSRSTLQRKLTKSTGIGAAKFIRQIRLATAHEFIQWGAHRTMAETAHSVGFSQAGYFSKIYKEYVSTLS